MPQPMPLRGRPPAPGKLYYLGRLRFRPGIDPPELEGLLEAMEGAEGSQRAAILRAALLGGLSQAQAAVERVEDDETAAMLDSMLAEF